MKVIQGKLEREAGRADDQTCISLELHSNERVWKSRLAGQQTTIPPILVNRPYFSGTVTNLGTVPLSRTVASLSLFAQRSSGGGTAQLMRTREMEQSTLCALLSCKLNNNSSCYDFETPTELLK